ncbi:MAG: penicillin-binding transpeptidase domain-containing protein, partial [Propionibacteriaceae bacterium]
GEQIGQSGLEQQHDATLRGKDGYRVDLVKRDPNYTPAAQPGSSIEILPAMVVKVDAVNGADLKTTLDKELQLRLEQQLASSATPTSIVMVQPSTGKILAMASGPTGQTQTSPNLDRNAPGSTFKIVSSLALFRKGLTPDSLVNCSQGAMVNGQKIENYPGYPDSRTGNLTLREVFWESCNTGFINSRDIFGHDGLVDAAASLGFGVDYETGFPADYGHVPDVKNDNEYAPQTFGQGTDQANALALTGISASISAGHTVVPYLIEETKIEIKATPLTSQEVTYLRDIMSNYVSHFNNEGGIISGCKTGTAEYTKPDGTAAAHGWLTSYNIPKDVAVTVFQYDAEGQNSTFAQTKKALS